MEYKIGDVVRLKTRVRSDTGSRTGWSERMNKYLGKEVTILKSEKGAHPLHSFFIKEDPTWIFWVRDIAALVERDGIRVAEVEEVKEDKKFVKEVNKIAEIAKSIYSEERVQADDYGVIIHFPEINISNSKKESHKILDLYVHVNIYVNEDEELEEGEELEEQLVIEIEGRRTTFTISEVRSNYIHSHLSSGGFGDWHSFCLGHSDFAILLANLCIEPTEEQWELFFLCLDKYVRWESLEGKPYISMSKISLNVAVSSDQLQRELVRILPELPLETFDIIEGKIVLNNSDMLYNFFDKYSKIRTRYDFSNENFDKLLEDETKSFISKFGKSAKIADKFIDYKIINNMAPSTDISKVRICQDIVHEYIRLFNNTNINFNILNYERERRNQKTFGEVRAV